jgi:hypothetical protein
MLLWIGGLGMGGSSTAESDADSIYIHRKTYRIMTRDLVV